MRQKPEIESARNDGEKPEGDGRIHIESLHFHYPTRMEVPVLKVGLIYNPE